MVGVALSNGRARNGIDQYARHGKRRVNKVNEELVSLSDNLCLMNTMMTGLMIKGKIEAEVN